MVDRTQVPARSRKRRIRSPHPGVVLLAPDPAGRHPNWRARFKDPDTNRTVKTTLDPRALRTKEARRDWAIAKSKTLARRRMDLEAGAHRATGTPLPVAIGRYYADHPRLREGTIGIYKRATDKLEAWASKNGLTLADQLTGPALVAFRGSLVREHLRTPKAGSKRGRRKNTDKPRKATSVNRDLRSVRTVLEYVRSLGLLPKITGDALRDGLKQERVQQERVEYLTSPELQALLTAALRHDEAMFRETRAEHAGLLPRGSTARYEPIAPLVALVILTGMRAGEARELKWDRVVFAANEIRLRGEDTKTGKPRDIDMAVSTALSDLVTALHEAKGADLQVFPRLTKDLAKSAARRLAAAYEAPPSWSWQRLRRTAGTFLTCSPAISALPRPT